jgi:hypothetical protein
MLILKFILLVIALFITLLWITKLVTDCVSAMYGNDFSEEAAQKDGYVRLYMITLISILWSIIIVIW